MPAYLPRSRLTVVRHASLRGEWHVEFLTPIERMAPFVRQLNVYSENHTAGVRRREPPSGLATIVFNLGDELRVEHPLDTSTAYGAGGAFYTGLSSTHAVTETRGSQAGAQVMLTPIGARRLLGFPLDQVGDRLIDPADLFGAAARRVVERLGDAASHTARLVVLEEEIGRLVERPGSRPPRDLECAAQQIECRSGRLSITELASDLGCSRKHLTTRFRREFGIGPKLLARVIRFDHAVRLIRRRHDLSWAGLAAACGYADQAHLTRDVREFTGSPPGEFLGRRLPDNGGWAD